MPISPVKTIQIVHHDWGGEFSESGYWLRIFGDAEPTDDYWENHRNALYSSWYSDNFAFSRGAKALARRIMKEKFNEVITLNDIRFVEVEDERNDNFPDVNLDIDD